MYGAYNETICDNTSIGHNNFETKVYYIISCTAEIVEEAVEQFKKLDGIIKEQFSKLYGYVAKYMSLKDRLESLFDIYHPEQKDSFGKIVDYDGNGFSFHSMQLMKLTTKDLIASIDYNDLVMVMYIVLVVMSLVLFLKIQLKSFVKH